MFVMQLRQHYAERGLESRYAKRRAVVLEHFFIAVMRRVIGRDRINGSIAGSFNQCGSILIRPERRIHFSVRVESDYCLFG